MMQEAEAVASKAWGYPAVYLKVRKSNARGFGLYSSLGTMGGWVGGRTVFFLHYSSIRPFIHSFIHPSIHSFHFDSPIHPPTHPPTHSYRLLRGPRMAGRRDLDDAQVAGGGRGGEEGGGGTPREGKKGEEESPLPPTHPPTYPRRPWRQERRLLCRT